MEDVLEVYTRPYDARYPQVCIDETSTQMLSDTRPALPMKQGYVERVDYEYKREGVANLFMCYEPLRGFRHVFVRERRTKLDWADCIRELLDVYYPHAERLVLVMDNLNTHTPAALYEAFEAAEARRLVERLEVHYTPKHGSWLDMAEIELSVLGRQCLDRRIGSIELLRHEVSEWEKCRNARGSAIDWRFTTADARIKLKHLYPLMDD